MKVDIAIDIGGGIRSKVAISRADQVRFLA